MIDSPVPYYVFDKPQAYIDAANERDVNESYGKLGFVGDLHIGARTGSMSVRQFIKEYIIDYLMPYFHSIGVDTVVQAGDMFDIRKFLYGRDRDWLKEEFKDACEKYSIEWHVIVGNHDITLADSNSMNWVEWLASEVEYVVDYAEPTEVNLCGHNILMMPWINKDNYDQCVEAIEASNAEIMVGHLELKGFPMYQGSLSEKGVIGVELLRKFEKVITGHYHTISHELYKEGTPEESLLVYLGTPYHLNWQDHKDGTNRGLWVLDENQELNLIQNNESQSLFRVVEYNYTESIKDDRDAAKNWADPEWLGTELGIAGQIVRINVTDRENTAHFKKFKDAVSRVNTVDYQIVDNTQSINTEAIIVREEVIEADAKDVMFEKIDVTDGVRKDELKAKLERVNKLALGETDV